MLIIGAVLAFATNYDEETPLLQILLEPEFFRAYQVTVFGSLAFLIVSLTGVALVRAFLHGGSSGRAAARELPVPAEGERIQLQGLAFANLYRFVATSKALLQVADAFEREDIRELDEIFQAHHVGCRVMERADVPPIDQHLTLIVNRHEMKPIAAKLRDLAARPDYATLTRPELVLVRRDRPNKTENVLSFVKLDPDPNFRRDYWPMGGLGSWSALLFHPDASADVLPRARETILTWGRRFDDGLEEVAHVDGLHMEPTELPPQRAFDRLSRDGDVSYVVVYFQHPLLPPFGRAYIDGEAWFYRDETRLVISAGTGSGDLRRDLENFFTYRKVLVDLVPVLNASRFAWGEYDDVNDVAVEDASEVRLLNDEATLWRCFKENLDGYLEEGTPAWVRREFSRLARQHLV